MASTIGIKIANGEFYPILEERSSLRKRLILTTVHDGQVSVQIDLYKSVIKSMADAEYIGSLVVENLTPKPKGEPSIELTITSSGGDEIDAEAVDLDSPEGGERYHLSVSLQALDENQTYDVPDFELEPDVIPPQGLYEKASEIAEKDTQRKGFPLIPILIALLVLLLIALGLWFFLLRPQTEPAAPVRETPKELPSTPAPVAVENPRVEEPAPTPEIKGEEPAQATPLPKEEPVQEAPVPEPPAPRPQTPPATSRTRPAAPVASYKVPMTIPPEGVQYKIRWGDTLWDIAEAFYRNPWLYHRIAQHNKIRDPDLIISGTSIRVPPKN